MRKDLKKHTIAGFAFAVVVAWTILVATPVAPTACGLIGYASAWAVGWLKEHWYDARRPEKHTVDREDVKRTAYGGAIGALAFILLASLIGD